MSSSSVNAYGQMNIGALSAANDNTAPEEEGEPLSASSNVAGSIRDVNAIGGTSNCVNCAAAVDATLGGAPSSALNNDPQPITNLVTDWNPVSGPMQIGSILSRSGNGSRGVVFGAALPGAGCGARMERVQQ
jgi:hypothetical protein